MNKSDAGYTAYPFYVEETLQTVRYESTITCRAIAHGAVYKTLLSYEHTAAFKGYIQRETGMDFTEACRLPDVIKGRASNWSGCDVKMVTWGARGRLEFYHD